MGLISKDKLKWIAGKENLNIIYLEKDYFLTLLLFQIKDIGKIYLKGGTAINKILLSHKRLSEDLDFTCEKDVKKTLEEIKNAIQDKDEFTHLEKVNSTDGYIRAKIHYKSYFQKEATIILDLNEKASVHLDPEQVDLPNFYDLEFKINMLNRKELVAEKIRALITRNQPRDYFDVYHLLEKYKVDWNLVEKKVKEAGEKYNRERILKNTQKVYSRWEEDLLPLVKEELTFIECIRKLRKELIHDQNKN